LRLRVSARFTLLIRNTNAKRFCFDSSRRARIESSLKVPGYLIVFLAVCIIPAAVGLGTIDFGLTARSHPPFVDQSSDVFTIDL
jgi:hypothetical protein